MEREKVIAKIDELKKRFLALDKSIQKENPTTLRFLDELKRYAQIGKIMRNGCWHATCLYKLKDMHKFNSLKEYYEIMGDSIDLVDGFEPIIVIVYDKNWQATVQEL